MSYISGSMGINIPQILVAGVEDAMISKGNMKDALVAGAAVGLSNLLPSVDEGMWTSGQEKYLAEPIIAGILYALGTKFIKVGEKEGSLIKKFGKGFIIGASSAAVAGQLVGYSYTTSTVKPMSIYNSGKGQLRGNIADGADAKPVVDTAFRSFVVS